MERLQQEIFERFHKYNQSQIFRFWDTLNKDQQLSLLRQADRIDMYQLLVCGAEICKGYSELVNPIQQQQAFEEQARNISNGDEEAFNPDNDFVRAMEHGFPPISGVGMGVDRLASIIFDQPTLRDVILFPIMK